MRFFLAALILLSGGAAAQSSPAEGVAAARDWRAGHAHEIVAGFADFLRIPNVAADPAGLKANAAHISSLYERRGFEMRIVEIDGAAPLVIGERKTDGATRTIAIYAHYDGQPVTASNWTNPPFEPTLYTRAIADGGAAIPFPRAGHRPADRQFRQQPARGRREHPAGRSLLWR